MTDATKVRTELENECMEISGHVGLPVIPYSGQEQLTAEEVARLADAYAATSEAYRSAAALALGSGNRVENHGYDVSSVIVRRLTGRLQINARGFRDD